MTRPAPAGNGGQRRRQGMVITHEPSIAIIAATPFRYGK
jgi:hypothetical protein